MNGKQLKNSILQWAIQGKLVPQDPNDEPASVLLERIREEKARLVKEKKIKKDKNESIIFRGDDNSHYEKFADGTVKCIDDEIPFEIPKEWEWARFGTIMINRDCERIPLSVSQRQYLDKIYNYYGASGVIDKVDKYLFDRDLLLIGEDGANLINRSTPIAFIASGKYWVNNHAHVLDACGGLNLKYVALFINAISLVDYVTGTAQPKMNQEKMNSILVAVPPKEEQIRILNRFSIIEPLIDRYDLKKRTLEQLNSSIYSNLRKSILQEAIKGKLVPQDFNDEPASLLLERIKEEKVKLFKEGKLKKKDLVDSVIFKGDDNKYYEKIGSEVTCIDDEIPLEIPDSWAWIRLGNIFQHNTGKALNGSNQKGVFYDYITTSNLYWNSFVLGKLRSMPFTDDELDKCTVKKGDLLVCEGGDIGRCAIWNYDYDIRIQNHIHRLRAYTPICTMFVYYTLYLYKHTGLIGGKGIGIQGLSSNALHKLLLPLPSIAEQKRIVDKIEFVIASIMRR